MKKSEEKNDFSMDFLTNSEIYQRLRLEEESGKRQRLKELFPDTERLENYHQTWYLLIIV